MHYVIILIVASKSLPPGIYYLSVFGSKRATRHYCLPVRNIREYLFTVEYPGYTSRSRLVICHLPQKPSQQAVAYLLIIRRFYQSDNSYPLPCTKYNIRMLCSSITRRVLPCLSPEGELNLNQTPSLSHTRKCPLTKHAFHLFRSTNPRFPTLNLTLTFWKLETAVDCKQVTAVSSAPLC